MQLYNHTRVTEQGYTLMGVHVLVKSPSASFVLCRFSLSQKTGHPCTALAFSLRRTSEFLVALADYSLKCFDTGQ